MNKLTIHTMNAARSLYDEEDKTIARFMEIVGLKDEYQDATNLCEPPEYIEYAQTMLAQKFADRGYAIGYQKLVPERVVNGIDTTIGWRLSLLHDDKVVVHKDININIGSMRQTEYGATM